MITFTTQQKEFALKVWKTIIPAGKTRDDLKRNMRLVEEIEAKLEQIPVEDKPAAVSSQPSTGSHRKRKRK